MKTLWLNVGSLQPETVHCPRHPAVKRVKRPDGGGYQWTSSPTRTKTRVKASLKPQDGLMKRSELKKGCRERS